jgi:hypothetical protein
MKRYLLALAIFAVPALGYLDWDIEVPYSDTSGRSGTIALDSSGEPHILYFVDGDHFYHIYKSSGAWFGPYPIEAVNYYTYCRVIDIAMVDDTANALMSMEYTASGDYMLWGKHLGGGIWSVEQIPNTVVPSNAGGYINVAISPGTGSSRFHVIYVYYNYGSPILYYRRYTDDWTAAEEVSSIPDVSAGWQNDIAVDTDDDPHVCFVYSDEGIKYRKKSGGAWGPVELVSSTTDPTFTAIATDGANYPHAVYDKDDFGAVCYRARSGSGWGSEQTIGAGGGWNTYGASIAVSGNQVFAAYYAQGDLKFAVRTITGWTVEDVDTTGDVGTYASLVLDQEGYAHIAYRDATNARLKYAKSTEPVVGIAEAGSEPDIESFGFTLHACPNPFSNKTDIRYQIPDDCEIAQLVIYDATGMLVKSFDRESGILNHVSMISWDGTDQSHRKLSSGIYFAKCDIKNCGDSQRYSVIRKILLVR